MIIRVGASGPRIALKNRHDLAQHLDETKVVFWPEEDPEETIRALCNNAKNEGFRAVCIRPEYVTLAKRILEGSPVRISAVIGFPKSMDSLDHQRLNPTFGNISVEEKIDEIRKALLDGADELDVMMNVPYFKQNLLSAHDEPEQYELAQLVENAPDVPMKLIIETDLLTDDEIVLATEAAMNVGILVVETSSGMLRDGRGARVENVEMIHQVIHGARMDRKPGIKANGEIVSIERAMALLEAGADILGETMGSRILDEFDLENHLEFNL